MNAPTLKLVSDLPATVDEATALHALRDRVSDVLIAKGEFEKLAAYAALDSVWNSLMQMRRKRGE